MDNKHNIILNLIKEHQLKDKLIETIKIFGSLKSAYISTIYFEGKSYYEVQIYGIVNALKHLEQVYITSITINRKLIKQNFDHANEFKLMFDEEINSIIKHL